MNNKRKNRGGSVRAQRQRSLVMEGVYMNIPFMHAVTSQVGNVARIRTRSGQVWEGVFRTFSSNFDVALEEAAKVENPDEPDSHLMTETYKEKMVFRCSDIMAMSFKSVDLDYAIKDTFQIDTAISARLNGMRSEERELEPWDAGQVNGNDVSLELDASNGWDVQEMFRKNEMEYGVQSNFDHSLRGYTVQLETSDSADYREAQAKAEKIASEIESQPAYKARLELENGDEEDAFAAVTRPQESASNGKYLPPARRKGQNNGKLVRSTPPPSASSSDSPSPKDTRPPLQFPNNSPQTNIHAIQGALAHPQQPPNQHVAPPPHMHNSVPQIVPIQVQPMGMPHNVVLPNNPPPPRPNSLTPPHQYQQIPPPPRHGGPHGIPHAGPPPHNKPQMNGELKTGPQQRQQRNQYPPMQERVVVPPGHPQGPPPPQVIHERKEAAIQNRPPPPSHQQPQPPTPRHDINHQESIKDLHSFSQDFKLASMPTHNNPNVPPPHQPINVPQGMPPPQNHTPHISGAESPQLVPHMGPPPQVQGGHSSGPSSNGSTSTLSTINSGSSDQNQASGGLPKQPSPAQSPSNGENEKMQNTVAKSKLNPNAKEFVLNPAAKPFTPRSPSTPSASRPHTPLTPLHNNQYITAVSGPPPISVMMPVPYMAISQQQYPGPPPQTSRIRKIPVNQLRPDMASQMQHAAAVTGQPLLAPAPLPQFMYPSAAAAAHGMNQAYQPAVAAMHAATIRMYDPAGAGPTQLPYLPPQQSQTPSPAQAQYNPAAVQQPPPQGYQYPHLQAVPHQQSAPQQMPLVCFTTQPHMLPNVPYLQQPPPGPPHQHLQVLVQHQHPSQGGNPHGPNP